MHEITLCIHSTMAFTSLFFPPVNAALFTSPGSFDTVWINPAIARIFTFTNNECSVEYGGKSLGSIRHGQLKSRLILLPTCPIQNDP
ncbi:hypothetical protein [Holospora curviuscula]|uniref:hypothetical protein n=1 Tax=Holospora curviuscula TaxID=1082868 RepID=UPI0013FD8384|nr:hypothetical protein [Holospora curviuscula]